MMPDNLDIAIVGLAGRFPGARSVDEFWRNLSNGVESIAVFTDDDVRAAGVDPAVSADSRYVKAGGVLDDIDLFDAAFFGYTPREAEVMDPQQRIFLECAWEAIEDAGYDTERYRRPIGVYAGMSMNTYVLSNLIYNPSAVEAVGEAQAAIGNLHDHLATRVSYTLDLRGPSFTVQTACSTSLVAVHLACQGLLGGECDMALAGGVSVSVPQKAGYLYNEGGTHSPDGRCRAFDAAAQGMVGGSGVGVVVLKRLEDAIADGDRIVAVVKGTAINNDGAAKVGYTAPSVEGQARVVRAALRAAAVPAETIGYIEAHGTGTPIGDPIEVEALARAFRTAGSASTRCGIGSVKTNVGHLDAAAGVAGLIKAALSLQHRYIPPTLHFERPNPRIDFAATPFHVVARGQVWAAGGTPRRAGVSAFGIGGTNAHAVLEEAPAQAAGEVSTRSEALLVSAKTASALAAAREQVAAHLAAHPDLSLADTAWTLQAGRRAFPFRAAVVASSPAQAAALLRASHSAALFEGTGKRVLGHTGLLLPGQGAQYPGMGRALYERFGVYHDAIDAVAAAVAPHLDTDLREVLGYVGTPPAPADAAERMRRTDRAQPALFAVEYATVQLLRAAGLVPAACVGHSIGEYVAACVAGVMTMPDAAALVAVRGRLMSAAPGGAMLAVGLDEREVVRRLHDGLSLAAVNGPSACVVAGGHDVVDALQGVLAREGVAVARLRTSHAFHSHLMDEVVERFRDEVAARTLLPPQMPFVSNLTGRWIQPAEATDPGYWARHLRQPVRFADGILEAARTCTRFVECGPGNALAALARQVLGPGEASLLTTLPRAESAERGEAEFLSALCSMWTDGVALDWTALADRPARRRVALPTYPFERHRFWIDPAAPSPAGLRGSASRVETGLQFSVPSWQRSPVPLDMASPSAPARRWLVLEDSLGLGAAIAERLDAAGHTVTRATVPDRPMAAGDHEGWLARAQAAGGPPQVIVYCVSASPHPPTSLATARARAFDGPVGLVRALFSRGLFSPVRLEIVSSNLWDVLGDEPLDPLQALLVGPLRVAPQEYPTIRSRNIDIVWRDNSDVGSAADEVVRELSSEPDEQTVAIRTGYRWVQRYVSAPLPRDTRVGGAPVIIFGGFGNIGLTAARAFADMGDTRLVLAGRRLNRQLPGVRDLEARGVDLLLLEADLENEAAVRAVFASARARFGRVGTVVHAAGPAGDAAMASLADATPEHVDGHFGAKVRGLMNLTAVVAEEAPSVVLLTSSLASVLGGLGMAAYAASNAVMDAVAAARNRCGATRWLAVNWDGWRFDGTQDPSSIGSSSGAAAFARITQANLPARVLVAAQALEPRLGQWINPGARETTAEARVSRRASTSATPPTNEVEQVVLQAWVDLLGVENIGIDDDFFGLGGHSLLATQLVSRLRRALLLDVPLRAIFDGPTVRAIAAGIVAAEPSPGRAAAAARLRLQVTQMTPDQLKTMLAARQSSAERAVR